MTTIYVPRLIESAEQAEAMPIETIASVLGMSPHVLLRRAEERARNTPKIG